MNSSQEIPGELVVSDSDAAEVFEPTKVALDDISAFVGQFVEAVYDDPIRFIGDDRFGPRRMISPKVIAIIPFVSEEERQRNIRAVLLAIMFTVLVLTCSSKSCLRGHAL